MFDCFRSKDIDLLHNELAKLRQRLELAEAKSNELRKAVDVSVNETQELKQELQVKSRDFLVLQQKLRETTAEKAEIAKQLESTESDRDGAFARLEKMQRALTLLEGVLDDTLQGENSLTSPTRDKRSNSLRHSKDLVSELLGETRIMAHKRKGATPKLDREGSRRIDQNRN